MAEKNNKKTLRYFVIGAMVTASLSLVTWLIRLPYITLNEKISAMAIDVATIKSDVVELKIQVGAWQRASEIAERNHGGRTP